MSIPATLAAHQVTGLANADLWAALTRCALRAFDYRHDADAKKRGLKPSQLHDPTALVADENGNLRYAGTPGDVQEFTLPNAWLREAFGWSEDTASRVVAVLSGRPSQLLRNPDLTKEEWARRFTDPAIRARAWLTLATPLLAQTGWDKKGIPVYRLNLVEITAAERAATIARLGKSSGGAPTSVRFPAVEFVPCGPSDPKQTNAERAAAKTERAAKAAEQAAAAAARIAALESQLAAFSEGGPASTQVGVPASTQVGTCEHAGGGTCEHAGSEEVREEHLKNGAETSGAAGASLDVVASPAPLAARKTTTAVREVAASPTGSDESKQVAEILSVDQFRPIASTAERVGYLAAALGAGLTAENLAAVLRTSITSAPWDDDAAIWAQFTVAADALLPPW